MGVKGIQRLSRAVKGKHELPVPYPSLEMREGRQGRQRTVENGQGRSVVVKSGEQLFS